MRRRPIIALVAVLVAAVVVVGLVQSGGGDSDTLKPLSAAEVQRRVAGAPAPIAAVHRQGNQILKGGKPALDARLAALKGTPVVLNVWGAWCDPCREEFPIFQHVSVEHAKTVAFLGIDTTDPIDNATAFLRKIPVPYPSYQDLKGTLASGFGLRGTPSTIFYDRAGKQTLHQGVYRSKADLESDIRRYATGA